MADTGISQSSSSVSKTLRPPCLSTKRTGTERADCVLPEQDRGFGCAMAATGRDRAAAFLLGQRVDQHGAVTPAAPPRPRHKAGLPAPQCATKRAHPLLADSDGAMSYFRSASPRPCNCAGCGDGVGK